LYLVDKSLGQFGSDGKDNIRFDFVSDEYNGRNIDPRTQLPREHITKSYGSLWQAIKDNSLSRVYLGVHWQFDGITTKGANSDGVFGEPDGPDDLGKIGGVWLGAQIATQVAKRLGVSQNTIAKSKT
jgi:vanadium chloroperoxidase